MATPLLIPGRRYPSSQTKMPGPKSRRGSPGSSTTVTPANDTESSPRAGDDDSGSSSKLSTSETAALDKARQPRRNEERSRENRKRRPGRDDDGDSGNHLFIVFGVLTFIALAVVLLAFYMQVTDDDDDGGDSVVIWRHEPSRNGSVAMPTSLSSSSSSSFSASSCFAATRLDEKGTARSSLSRTPRVKTSIRVRGSQVKLDQTERAGTPRSNAKHLAWRWCFRTHGLTASRDLISKCLCEDCAGKSFITAKGCVEHPAPTRAVVPIDRSIIAAPVAVDGERGTACADNLVTESDNIVEQTAMRWCLRQDPAILSNDTAFAECMCTRCDLRRLIVEYDACSTSNNPRFKIPPPPSPTTRFGCAGYARDPAGSDPTLTELRAIAWCALAYGPQATEEAAMRETRSFDPNLRLHSHGKPIMDVANHVAMRRAQRGAASHTGM
eukprot:gene1196-1768_t